MNLDKRLLHHAQKARFNLTLTVGLGLLVAILTVAQAYYLAQVVNRVFLNGDTLGHVRPLLVILLALALVRAGLVWAEEVTAQRVANRVKSHLRHRLNSHLLALGPAYTQGQRSGELTNTVVEGVEALNSYFSQYIPQLARAALVPLTILVVVFPLDFTSALVLLLTAPLIPVFMMLIGHQAQALTRRQWSSLSRMSAHFLDVLQGITTLKLFGRSREQIQVIAQISHRFGQTTLGVLRVAFLSALVLEMVATISIAVVAVEVGLRLLYGRLAFEQALFVLILAPEYYMPLRLLGTHFHAGLSGVAAARRIFEVLETPLPLPVAGESPQPTLPPLNFDIHFTNVAYAYDGGQRPALNSLTCHLPAGQKTALVGPSGAGKSTVAHLLLRFIKPDSGQITVNAQPLSSLGMSTWRAQIAWVPQAPHLFHASIEENIRLARPNATLDQVRWAAQQAHADTFIRALPRQYATVVGEQGARLSGGQAQRIALARAFLKDAPFLILDEATANLDPQHEAHLQDSMARLMQGRTVLIIAHRLNTVVRADNILVIEGGQLVEAGTHAGLLQQKGLYHQLVAAYGGAK